MGGDCARGAGAQQPALPPETRKGGVAAAARLLGIAQTQTLA
jgi:hypothetical protein